MNRSSSSLSMLLAAAAALTGTTVKAANEEAPTISGTNEASNGTTRVSYRYSSYDEDALPTTSLIGDAQRYSVRTQQFHLITPVNENSEITLNGTQEVMSGSSPWFVLPDAHHHSIQVMSGATIKESRRELQVGWAQDSGSNKKTSLNISHSRENDYRATALSLECSQPFSASLTFGYGGSFSHDLITPSDAIDYGRVEREAKNSASFFTSLAWVLDRSSVLQTGIQLDRQQGFLSDPYKLVSVENELLQDTRPGERAQLAWLLRYRHAFADQNAALHVDYRLSMNSWSMHSHTVDVAWHQGFGHGWRLAPGLRYYSQTSARFYAPFFQTRGGERFFSSDYRLGTYGSFSTNINLRKILGTWELSFGAERYRSAEHYALGGHDNMIPGLVDFTQLSLGIDHAFE